MIEADHVQLNVIIFLPLSLFLILRNTRLTSRFLYGWVVLLFVVIRCFFLDSIRVLGLRVVLPHPRHPSM